MRKWNRMLILMLVVVIMTGILVGCGTGEATFEGVGSTKLTKDLNKLRDLVIESMQKDEYQEDKIEAILDKIRDEEYQKDLSIDETILINKINKSKRDIQYDLSTGDRKMTSSTFDDVNWLIQAR